MTAYSKATGNERRLVKIENRWYAGRAQTIGELAAIAREISREQLRRIVARAIAAGLLAVL
jgi:hypothetical protein